MGTSFLRPQTGGGAPSPIIVAKRLDAFKMQLGMEIGLSPRRRCVRWGPNRFPKKGRSPLPKNRPMFVAKRLDGSRWHSAWSQASAQATLCWMGTPGTPSPKRGRSSPSPIFSPFLLWPNGWMHQNATWYGGRLSPCEFVLDGTHSG